MKRRLLICGMVGSVFASSVGFAGTMGEAVGDDVDFQFYVGADYRFSHSYYRSADTVLSAGSVALTINPKIAYPNNFSGIMLNTGFRYQRFIGMEFGYTQFQRKSKTLGISTVSFQPRAGYGDLKLYYPIQKWDIYGIAGVSFGSIPLFQFTTPTILTQFSSSTVAPRLGLGVDYNFNQHIGVRVEGKYAFIDSPVTYGKVSANTGIYYFF